MIKKMLIIVMLINISAAGRLNDIKDISERNIKSLLGSDVKLEFKKFIMSPDIKRKAEGIARQKFFGDFVYIWKIYTDGKLSHTAILDNVTGKTMPITFMAIFDTGGKIINCTIVEYREQYGGGVASDRWLNQFKGKNWESDYEIGRGIDSISGATISARSVTAGIHKLSILFKLIAEIK